MNLSYSLILAFVGIAGPTSAEPTSIFMPFENDLDTVRTEVVKYCDDPTEYDKSSLYGPIKDWDVSALTTMAGLFSEFDTHICHSCTSCNPPVSNWNVSAVEHFNGMFYEAAEFNQDLSKWVVGKGHKFNRMFYGAAAFNQDLSGWDVGKGHSFGSMFKDSGMNHYIGGWDIKCGDGCENELSAIFSMLGINFELSRYRNIHIVEKMQFINLITPPKIEDMNS